MEPMGVIESNIRFSERQQMRINSDRVSGSTDTTKYCSKFASLGLILGLRFEIILFLDGPRSGFRFPLGEYANCQLHYPTAGAEKIIRGQGSLCFSCIRQRSRWSWMGLFSPNE